MEDEPLQRMMICDLVETAGFMAETALDAEDAISILENRSDIRVVFADIDMPGGHDGLKLAALIRNRWPPIEFILTSGKKAPNLADVPARGVYVAKPYQQELIIAAVRRFASTS